MSLKLHRQLLDPSEMGEALCPIISVITHTHTHTHAHTHTIYSVYYTLKMDKLIVVTHTSQIAFCSVTHSHTHSLTHSD